MLWGGMYVIDCLYIHYDFTFWHTSLKYVFTCFANRNMPIGYLAKAQKTNCEIAPYAPIANRCPLIFNAVSVFLVPVYLGGHRPHLASTTFSKPFLQQLPSTYNQLIGSFDMGPSPVLIIRFGITPEAICQLHKSQTLKTKMGNQVTAYSYSKFGMTWSQISSHRVASWG